MSRKNPIDPALTAELPARVVKWLTENPGSHRARDVAHGMGVPDGVPRKDWSQRIAQVLSDAVRVGNRGIVREYITLPGWKAPIGHYSIPNPEPEPEPEPAESAEGEVQ